MKVRRSAEGAGRVPAAAPGRPTCATHARHPGSCPAPPPPCPSGTVRKGAGGGTGGARDGVPAPPGRTHVIEEGAGVDGNAEALGLRAVCTQAVQHVRHGAHDAHQHLPAALEEALEEGRQLSAEQASLSRGRGTVGREFQGWLPLRPLPRPPSRPGHACCTHPTPSHPGSAVQGDVLLALVCPPGVVDRRDRLPLSESLGSSWGQGSANPCRSAASSFLSVPFLARGSPTKSWRPTFPSSALPRLCPHSWLPQGTEGSWGPDKTNLVGWAPLKSLASHVAGKWVPQWGPQTF